MKSAFIITRMVITALIVLKVSGDDCRGDRLGLRQCDSTTTGISSQKGLGLMNLTNVLCMYNRLMQILYLINRFDRFL